MLKGMCTLAVPSLWTGACSDQKPSIATMAAISLAALQVLWAMSTVTNRRSLPLNPGWLLSKGQRPRVQHLGGYALLRQGVGGLEGAWHHASNGDYRHIGPFTLDVRDSEGIV